MRRVILFLVLLLAGFVLIFLPYRAFETRFSRPSGGRLPVPWNGEPMLRIRPQLAQANATGGPSGACGEAYAVQRGETLGEVARRCEVPLTELLAANPQLEHPDRIAAGQTLVIPARGSLSNTTEGSVPDPDGKSGFLPGAVIELEADGFPPDQPVRIGLGLSSAGYRVLDQAVTGSDGRLAARITLPEDAKPGDSAFLMITTQRLPARQAISETFTIGQP